MDELRYYIMSKPHNAPPEKHLTAVQRDIIARFRNPDEESRERTDKSFFVPKDEIVENDYDLSINKYKKTEYIAEEYPEPKEILAEIKALEEEILKGIEELEELL